MKLLIVIIFYIANVSFFIKADCTSFQLNPNLLCLNNQYYDTMNCNCDTCLSGLINENICYSNSPRSLYNDQNLNPINCTNGTLTELDDTGNWLGYLICGNTNIDYENPKFPEPPTISNSFSFYYSNNEYKVLEIYNNINIKYYYFSCIEGFYEQSCQYLANLCVLSMYSQCDYISTLSQNLIERGIVNSNLL